MELQGYLSLSLCPSACWVSSCGDHPRWAGCPATAVWSHWTLSARDGLQLQLLMVLGWALPLESGGEDQDFSGCRKSPLLGSTGPGSQGYPTLQCVSIGYFSAQAGLTTFLQREG